MALFYLDLLVEKTVVVEIKAFSHKRTTEELAQVINYLKATQAPVGSLFFGRRRLEWARVLPIRDKGPVRRLGRDDVRKSLRRS